MTTGSVERRTGAHQHVQVELIAKEEPAKRIEKTEEKGKPGKYLEQGTGGFFFFFFFRTGIELRVSVTLVTFSSD
jgi:hypothetical protein